MTRGPAGLRQAVQRELMREAGAGADAKAVASAALRMYGTLADALARLIGDGGVRALTARSLHLVGPDFPWLAEAQGLDPAQSPFARVARCLEQQDAAVAREAASAAMATLGGLLAALIGEPLTRSTWRAAWPTAFAGSASPRETRET
jgi:hypothetical protein